MINQLRQIADFLESRRAKGAELTFISRIRRDGSGTIPLEGDDVSFLDDYTFNLMRLSISEDTYIASGFNSYVVRKKERN